MKKKEKKPVEVKLSYIKWDDDLFKALSLFFGDNDNNVKMPRLFVALWQYLTTGDADEAEKDLTFKEIMFFRLAIQKVVRGD